MIIYQSKNLTPHCCRLLIIWTPNSSPKDVCYNQCLTSRFCKKPSLAPQLQNSIFFLSYFPLLFYFIQVKLNYVCPKDKMGPVFVRTMKVLYVYAHDLCVNATSGYN